MGGQDWTGVGPGDRRAVWRGLAARRRAMLTRARLVHASSRETRAESKLRFESPGSLRRPTDAALISIGPASAGNATTLPFQDREPIFAVEPGSENRLGRPARKLTSPALARMSRVGRLGRRVGARVGEGLRAIGQARGALEEGRRAVGQGLLALGGAASDLPNAARRGAALFSPAALSRASRRAARVGRIQAKRGRKTVHGNWTRETRRWRAAAAAGAAGAVATAHLVRRGAEDARRVATRRDALVAGLALLALLGPIASPRLGPETAMALSRDNPFVERRHVRAELSPVVLPLGAPTLWNGRSEVRGRRAVAPQWVRDVLDDRRALSVALAMIEGPRVIEVAPAPLWSPHLAAAGFDRPDEEVLRAEDWLVSAPDASAGDIETASIPEAVAPADRDDADRGRIVVQSAPPSYGLRPVRRPDGPAAPSSVEDREITILLTAVGLNRAASVRAIESLPGVVAIAVPPVVRDPAEWVAAAQATGRVVLAEVPMEHSAFGRVNRDALTLLTSLDADQNVERLTQTLDRVPEVDGVATYLGGRFTTDAEALRPVLSALASRELFIVETGATPESRLASVAQDVGLPQRAAVLSLDRGGRSGDLTEAFARLEEAAASGPVIGVATALPASVDALLAWIVEAEARGVRLRPLQL